MKKLITYGFVLTLSFLLAFNPTVLLAMSSSTSSLTSPGIKSTRPAKPRRPFMPARSQTGVLTGQTSTLLPDGRLLIVGGQDSDGPKTTISINDPRTGDVFPMTVALNQARAWHSATMLPNGRVLIVGGTGADNKTVGSAEIVDPAAQTVEAISAPAFARSHHTATLLTEGRVLIVGGVSATGQALNRVELWDFKTKSAAMRSRAARSSIRSRCVSSQPHRTPPRRATPTSPAQFPATMLSMFRRTL